MYYLNEGSIDLPEQWQDQSINVLTTAPADSKGLSFTISRDQLPWKMSFVDYAENELDNIAASLTEFSEIKRVDFIIDEQPARLMEYTWVAKQGKLHQLMAIAAKADRAIVFTATMPGALNESQRDSLVELIQTFRFRDSN